MDPSANIFTFSTNDQPPEPESAKRRNAISLEQRRQLRIRYNEDRTQKQKDLAAWFEATFQRPINQSSISDTLSEKYNFLDETDINKVLGQTRIARVDFPELESALYRWQLDREAEGVKVTGANLCEQAHQIWAELPRAANAKEFKASNGWLEGYRKRHGLGKHSMSEHTATPPRKRQKIAGRLQDRVAIVTGASSGMGRAIAVHFAAEGARVVCSDLTPTPASAIATAAANAEGKTATHLSIQSLYGEESATFIQCNVAIETEVQALVAQAAAWGSGRVDIMVNNAGIGTAPSSTGQSPRLHELSSDQWDRQMAVNAKGVFHGCKHAITQFLSQEPRAPNERGDATKGWIVNIASALSEVGFPRAPAYVASKHAALGLTRQIAVDYAGERIHCNAISPGWSDTNMIAHLTSNPMAQEWLKGKHPWGALGQANDIAKAAVFLACDDASFVTGHNLHVDGGYLAQ